MFYKNLKINCIHLKKIQLLALKISQISKFNNEAQLITNSILSNN
jgi:hypothetical protein